MLSKEASSIIFWVFGMISTWDWTQVSRAIDEHSNHDANVRWEYISLIFSIICLMQQENENSYNTLPYISRKSLYPKNLIWLEKNECAFWIQRKKLLKNQLLYIRLWKHHRQVLSISSDWSSSSSYRAGSTDIPDPFSPLLPIVHRPR